MRKRIRMAFPNSLLTRKYTLILFKTTNAPYNRERERGVLRINTNVNKTT